ncbi:MAG TPA: hypothetical protein VHF25_07875 [Nitriliruptorales bacterium]|nr:hypothetical protein [Nitriliruptorales bacterium]
MAVEVLDDHQLATAEIRPQAATYSWQQLFAWYKAINDVMSRDVVLTDIDELNNVIVVGVSDLGRHGADVQPMADAQEIPDDALLVIETEPVRQVPLIEERSVNGTQALPHQLPENYSRQTACSRRSRTSGAFRQLSVSVHPTGDRHRSNINFPSTCLAPTTHVPSGPVALEAVRVTVIQHPGRLAWLGISRQRMERDARTVAAAVSAGAIVGFVINGWGSRLAMMLLARKNPQVTGRVSDDGFRMGQFVLADTMGLVLLGTILGVVGGLLYLVIRPLRFGAPWFQHLALFVGPAVVVGSMLVHTDGIDFHVLDPPALAIALFVALPGIFALAVALLTDRWLRDGSWFRTSRIGSVVPVLLLLVPFWPLLIVVVVGWSIRQALLNAVGEGVPAGLVWVGRAGLAIVFALALVRLVGMTIELV